MRDRIPDYRCVCCCQQKIPCEWDFIDNEGDTSSPQSTPFDNVADMLGKFWTSSQYVTHLIQWILQTSREEWKRYMKLEADVKLLWAQTREEQAVRESMVAMITKLQAVQDGDDEDESGGAVDLNLSQRSDEEQEDDDIDRNAGAPPAKRHKSDK